MQRKIRPALLQENRYQTLYSSPIEKILDVTYLNGGLNLWELDYRLDANQSPDLLNVYWKDGSLSSRQGQAYVPSVEYSNKSAYAVGAIVRHNSLAYKCTTAIALPGEEWDASHWTVVSTNNAFYACYEKPWQGYMIAHKGTKLYKIDYSTGEHTELVGGVTLSEVYGGTFFVFGDALYYMNGVEYAKVDNNLNASIVEGYIPTVIVNRYHDGTGGSTYQDENRIQAGKKIQFTTGLAAGEEGTELPKTYNVPTAFCPMDGKAVVCKLTSPVVINYNEYQEYTDALPTSGYADIYYKLTVGETVTWHKWNGTTWEDATAPSNGFKVNRTTGVVTFDTAPVAHLTQTPSNLDVTVFKTNALAKENILSCRCVTVYGGDTELAVVCGGPTSTDDQGNSVANAFFWSGSNSVGLDPTYFPFDYYNYAGSNSAESIIAFGKQQNMLVIFKENSIGKSYFEVKTVETKDSSGNTVSSISYLNLPYSPLNDTIGCNLEKSVRLIQNNLVFANTYGGVYVLLDTTAAGENTVKRLSRNVNGDNAARSSGFKVLEYASASSFPAVGVSGVYYKAIDTSKYYVWPTDGTEYLETRLSPPASGLMYDLRAVSGVAVSSFDDGQRYWIVANSHAYLWDYTISSINSYEKNMCWFYFDNIIPTCWFKTINDNFYGKADGSFCKFIDTFNDFGSSIPRRYVFATQNFNTFEVFKDVLKVILAVRSDTDTAITLTYKTDYETRVDKTPIRAYTWRFIPRDLTHRCLRLLPFAGTAVRTPRCFHIRYFQMMLTNNTVNTDMSIISAQIVYRFSREDR